MPRVDHAVLRTSRTSRNCTFERECWNHPNGRYISSRDRGCRADLLLVPEDAVGSTLLCHRPTEQGYLD
jgi:hypothetical protein